MVDILSRIKDIEDFCKSKPETHVFRSFEIPTEDFSKYNFKSLKSPNWI